MNKISTVLICSVFFCLTLGMGLIRTASADSILIYYIGEGNIHNDSDSDSNGVAVSGNGERVITTKFKLNSDTQWTILWDIPEAPVGVIAPVWNHSAGPFTFGYGSPSISDNGSRMVAIEKVSNSIVRCFGTTSATVLWSYTGSGMGNEAKISDDGQYIAYASINEVTLLDKDGVTVWSTMMGGAQSICISGDGSVIAVGFLNGSVVCFDNISSIPKWTTPVILANSATRIAISKDGSTIVAGCLVNSPDVSVIVLNAMTGSVLWKRACYYCLNVAISSNGNRIFLTSWNTPFDASMYSRDSNATLWTITTKVNGDGCDLSQDAKIAIFGDMDGHFHIVNGSSGQVLLNFTGPLGPSGGRINDCSISDNGSSIVAMSRTGAFFMFRLAFTTSPAAPAGDPLDLIQWILIGGLAAGLVIVVVIAVKQGKGRKS